jgi:hypothetical protein
VPYFVLVAHRCGLEQGLMGKVVLDISAGLPVRNRVRLIIGHELSLSRYRTSSSTLSAPGRLLNVPVRRVGPGKITF